MDYWFLVYWSSFVSKAYVPLLFVIPAVRIVIPNERSEEGSPNAANCLRRYLDFGFQRRSTSCVHAVVPAVDMTQWGGQDDERKGIHFYNPDRASSSFCHPEMSIAIEGSPNAANCTLCVIPTERSDEESPKAANCLMRYLPAVDMTHWGGRYDNVRRSI